MLRSSSGWGGSPTFAGLTLTGPLLAPDGTAVAPSYSFASNTSLGMRNAGSNTLALTTPAGSFLWDGSIAYIQKDNGALYFGLLNDLTLYRDAANTLAQRNGVNAQAFRLYNTFTDVSNKEYGELVWSSGNLYLQTNAVGTGAQRNVVVRTLGGTNVYFGVNGINRFRIDATAGHFFAETDNTNDIGAAGANRPRNIYAGSSVLTAGTGGIGYATGAGGAVTQITSKTTGVTLNAVCGQITMNAASLAAGAQVNFTVTNSTVAATDIVDACRVSGGTAGSYQVWVDSIAAGSFVLTVKNTTAGALAEAVVIGFSVMKAVIA